MFQKEKVTKSENRNIDLTVPTDEKVKSMANRRIWIYARIHINTCTCSAIFITFIELNLNRKEKQIGFYEMEENPADFLQIARLVF